MIRVGVTGIGSIGARHARVLAGLDGVEVHVHDAVAGAEEIGARVGPGVLVEPSLDALLDRAPDGLVVATPDEFHLAALLTARAAGVPVLVEKPLAADRDAARTAVATLQDRGQDGAVLVGYVLHHYACMRRAHARLREGAVGTPVSFHAELGAYETLTLARSRFDDTAEGRLFVDYSHEWDYLRWLLGPVAGGLALARLAGDLPLRQRPNVVDAVLRLADGTTGSVHLDYVQDPARRTLVVIGDRGRLTVDVVRGSVTTVDRDGRVHAEDCSAPRDAAFTAQARHFLDVAAGRSAPAVTVQDALAALDVAAALARSAATGQWVDVEAGT